MRIARSITRELAAGAARAVVLTGSHVRGDAHAHSDIDLIVIVRRRPSAEDRRGWLRPMRIVRGHLVTLAWETAGSTRKSFRDPKLAPSFVPGWRGAVILHDPEGVAAAIQRRAIAWTWDAIAAVTDAWVAERITGWAEEVHKLAGMLARGPVHAAAVQRSLLAISLAGILARRHRVLYGSENVLWDLVAARMGEPWASAQAAALSERAETLDASCRAALEMYAIAAADVRPLLDRRQCAVVDAACAVARDLSTLEVRRRGGSGKK